jgi:hypothetical protein
MISLPITSVGQPIAAAVLLGDAKARHKLDKRLSIKSKLLRPFSPTHASSTRKATSDKSLVGQGDDDTCLSYF